MSLANSCLAALIKTCGVAEVQATAGRRFPGLPSKLSEKLNTEVGTEKQKSGLPSSSSILAACRNRVSGFTGGRHQPSCEANVPSLQTLRPDVPWDGRRVETTHNDTERTGRFQSAVNVVTCDSGMRGGNVIAHRGGNNCHWFTDACRDNKCSSLFFKKKNTRKKGRKYNGGVRINPTRSKRICSENGLFFSNAEPFGVKELRNQTFL